MRRKPGEPGSARAPDPLASPAKARVTRAGAAHFNGRLADGWAPGAAFTTGCANWPSLPGPVIPSQRL